MAPVNKSFACVVIVCVSFAIDLALQQARVLGTAFATAPATPAATVEFFVSPKGNDRWSGRLAEAGADDGPFATLERARDAIRALRRAQAPQIPVRVTVRGGTYFIERPIEFGPEDSGAETAPVVYSAAAGERVVLRNYLKSANRY